MKMNKKIIMKFEVHYQHSVLNVIYFQLRVLIKKNTL
jgi:hypothetical protein